LVFFLFLTRLVFFLTSIISHFSLFREMPAS
jgi:hypothetical protein